VRSLLILALSTVSACTPSPLGPAPAPDPKEGSGGASQCFALHLGGTPSPDVALPAVIELTREPAPGFVEPGRLAVREPAGAPPRAPISWWIPQGRDVIELVLGGGYTGYKFALTSAPGGGWTGTGTYFADFGLDPAPAPLPLRLSATACP
jgi:hypothetical protein